MDATPFDTPAIYRISVWGVLDEKWSSRLSGVQITHAGEPGGFPITTLTGVMTDQTAVAGLLQKLYSLGFTLLSLQRLDGD
jgi:hypothetical protein